MARRCLAIGENGWVLSIVRATRFEAPVHGVNGVTVERDEPLISAVQCTRVQVIQ